MSIPKALAIQHSGSQASSLEERLGVLISLVGIGLLASILLPLPSHHLSLQVFGSDLSFDFSGAMQLMIILGVLVCAGVDGLLRTQSEEYLPTFWANVTFWALPMLVALEGLLGLHSLIWWGYQILAALLTAALLTGVLLAQLATLQASKRRFAPLFLIAMIHLTALGGYVALYGARVRSLISATGVLVMSAGLSLELYRHTGAPLKRVWLYGLITGLAMGELTWALNYTRLDARVGGAFLLLAFYLLTGVARQHLWGRLTRRVALEFVALGVIGLAALARLA